MNNLLRATLLLALATPVRAADWPMWRYDAARSAVSPQQLPAKLHLQWAREYPPEIQAWPEQEKMPFDACYEPIVGGRTLFLNSSRHDCIRALDIETGEAKWTFFADGPIRFAPVYATGKLYFTSDDGHLYCVDAERGSLLWKVRGGPSDRRILGNERLISTWPARGAPVLADGKVYFGASIWPFMGIFIHAVDAETGRVAWTNDGDGSVFIKQPHMTEAFAGVAPQGPFAVQGDRLFVPGGRSVPAILDRTSGKLHTYLLGENGKLGGGSDIAVRGDQFFNGGAVFATATGKYQGDLSKHVVPAPEAIYAHVNSAVRAYDPATIQVEPEKRFDKDGKEIKPPAVGKGKRWPIEEIALAKMPSVHAMIKAGDRLYVGGERFVVALDVDLATKRLSVSWEALVPGTVVRLVAGADRLVVATREGEVYCYGGAEVEAKRHTTPDPVVAQESVDWKAKARQLIADASHAREGSAVVWGLGSGGFVRELLKQTKLEIVVVEPDAKKADLLRRQFVAEDWYGSRVAILPTAPRDAHLPPYFAQLSVCADAGDAGEAGLAPIGPAFLDQAFASVRPYGGVLAFFPKQIDLGVLESWAKTQPEAKVEVGERFVFIRRPGALAGAGNWTHEHGDAANTRVALDSRVKAPLGLLWFGGPSNDGILPRHGHGPQPQVVDGRMIIEGVDLVRALDIYTGRLLWERKLPGVGQFYNNLAHQAGANASGGNLVSTPDGVYVVWNSQCVKLDLDSGKTLATFKLPSADGKGTPRWGYLNVVDDYLVGGAEPLFDPKSLPPKEQGTGNDDEPKASNVVSKSLAKVVKSVKAFSDNLSSSRRLVVMNRKTGEVLWQATATHGWRHNGICVGGGRLYAIDRLSGDQLAKLKLTAEEVDPPFRLVAFDLGTGKALWSSTDDVFGTWLSYSAKHDVLVEAGRYARDSLRDEPKGMRAYKASTGVALWRDKAYLGPAMIHGDMILQDTGACDLLTGKPKLRVDPITGEKTPWKWVRTYGCNTPAASEHLLTFRSGAAGYYDLCHDGGTGNFGGFRSSCTNNLIVAGGILTAPEYTRTCTCSYQNQSSIALIHMPEVETWTFFGVKDLKGSVRRLGLNFGAAGDRRADDGTLWLEHPSTGGASPAVAVSMTPKAPQTFRRFSGSFAGPNAWIVSSGAIGVDEVAIPLGRSDTKKSRTFVVRLHFAEPEDAAPGARRFHVDLQGERVLSDFDVVREAGALRTGVVREFRVPVVDTLTVRLRRADDRSLPTIVSGIEVVEESR